MAVRELTAAPNLTRLYAKAALAALRGGAELPDTELRLSDVRVDRAHVAAYARVCGFLVGDRLPPTYPHLLAFPLAVELMAEPSFPFPLPGLVHIANRIVQRRVIDAGERLTVAVSMRDLRPHRRGRQFDAVAMVMAGDETVWESHTTYLRREATNDSTESGSSARRAESATPGSEVAPNAVWRVPADTGRRYAAVSGDRNPIHLHPLSARLFGFPRAIAHGMWTKARCLAAVERAVPDRCDIAVTFGKPVLLPATVSFHADVGDDVSFSLRDRRSGAVHLDGRIDR